MFTDIDFRFIAVVRKERGRFYQRQMRRPFGSESVKLLLALPKHFTVWFPKTAYLLWLFKVQPREVQEKIISYLPAADGCLAVALDLYNEERYIDHMKSRDNLTLVAVQYRFGFIVVL